MAAVLGSPSAQDWSEGEKMAEKRGLSFPYMSPTSFNSLISGRDVSPEAIDLMENMLKYNP